MIRTRSLNYNPGLYRQYFTVLFDIIISTGLQFGFQYVTCMGYGTWDTSFP